MSLKDSMDAESHADALALVANGHAVTQGKLDQARRERDALKRTNGALEIQVGELEHQLGIRQAVAGIRLKPPKWQTRKRTSKAAARHATAWLNFSDWHFDEVVDVDNMNGLNAYNRKIGEQRLQRWAEAAVAVATAQALAFDYDGAVLSINGDVFSGWIHGLKETNDGNGLFRDVRHWGERIVAAIDLLLTVFPHIDVYVTVGNHGRLSVLWDTKRSVSENIEYLLGLTLADHFEHDPRVSVHVAESVDLLFSIYDLRVLQTHGNTGGGNGGGGLAGFWPRIGRMRLAKQSLYRNQGGFDVLTCGHFHQYKPGAFGFSGFIINGAGKGFDDYARDGGFEAEPAVQAMSIVTPDRGIISHHPLFLTDRKTEGW